MDARQPGPIAERHRRARRAARRRPTTASTPARAARRRSPSTCRIPATSARSCASPRPAARPACVAAGGSRRSVRLEGAARIDGQRAAAADRRRRRRRATAVADARRHGCRIVATVPRGGRSLFDVDLTGPVAVLIGGEGAGLPPALVDAADERVTIPMQAPVESLNAAVTAALIVYEARRQRARRSNDELDVRRHRHGFPVPDDDAASPKRGAARRWPSACGRGRSTSSSARRICSRRASRCARRSSAICCSRSSCGDRPAPARRRSRASSPTRRRRASSRSARCSPASRKSAR